MTNSYEDISKRAFEIWEQEGKPTGKEQDHWLLAEAELRTDSMKNQKGRNITSQDASMLKTPKA